MLLKIAPHISECLERARLSRARAEKTGDQGLKADYLDIERTWLHLAESYRTVEQLEAFLADAHGKQTSVAIAETSDAAIEQLAERISGNSANKL